MKSNVHPSLYFSMYPLTTPERELTEKNSQQQSPYLKSVLSAKGGSGNPGDVRMINSDKLAAIRYIRESRMRKIK